MTDEEQDTWEERMRLIRQAAMDFADALADMAEAVRRLVDASLDVERA